MAQSKQPRTLIPSSCRERGRRRRRNAVAAVELALLLPLLVLLFVLAVDFARVYYFSLTVTNCARAAALYAGDPSVQNESPFASLEAAALSDATNLSPQPKVASKQGTDELGQPYVEVQVSYAFSTITGYLGSAGSQTITRTIRVPLAPATPSS
jgi:Flp pilus assembly protein TadG